MGVRLPENGYDKDSILKELEEVTKEDLNPLTGKMFGHSYETGDNILRELSMKVYKAFMHKTMLDFTVYPSLVKLENEIVSMVLSIMHGEENSTGSFTYGGTESIMLATKASREYFRKKKGEGVVPELILPMTGHPSFVKAAEYLNMKVKFAPVDYKTLKVDVDKVNELINDRTAMIVGSAPNYPFGTIDDIAALSDIAIDKKVWLHTDSCIGGFVLPFFKMLGEKIPDFDFKLPGVYSISADLHKYGYAPKGASVVLYRSKELKLGQIFVGTRWPGYPLVNTAVLSTRSAGPLAASWAILKYLGVKGYKDTASRILSAKRKIILGLKEMGFQILGEPESSLVAFTSDEVNLSKLSSIMEKKGWYIQVQPGSDYLKFPSSIHLTLSPVHDELARDFLADLKEALEEAKKMGESDQLKANILRMIRDMEPNKIIEELPRLLEYVGVSSEKVPKDLELVDELIKSLAPDLVEVMLKHVINEILSP